MSVAERIELARRYTNRVTNHILYVLELHETNRIVLYSPTLASQIPTSHAANAFGTFQRGLHQMEIVRLCALWDSAELEKENIPTVIDLIDHPDVIAMLAEETASQWTGRSVCPSDLPDGPEIRAAINDAFRRYERDFGRQQARLLRAELDAAIIEARSIQSSDTHASIMNLRDKHLAHSLTESRREQKAGHIDPMKYGDERVMLEATLRIATALMCWVKGASFNFAESCRIHRANAEALWTGCTFEVKR